MNICHGAPGAIPLLHVGAQLFPEIGSRLIVTSVKIGERIWEEGILKLGNGIA